MGTKKQSLKEYLSERRLIQRGFLLVVALIGMVAGAILMLFMALLGVL